jgi:ABC-2 type transport system permease protein
MRLLHFLGVTLALSFARDLAYRLNFAFALLQAAVLAAAGIFTIGMVYRQANALAGWSEAEVLVLFGMFQVMSGLLATFVEPNTRWFGNLVRSGAMDDFLLKPMPGLFLASLGRHAPPGLVQVVIGLATVTWGLAMHARWPSGPDLGLWIVLLALGIVIVWAMRVSMALVSLVAPSLTLDVVYDSAWQFTRYPIGMYGKSLRAGLMWALPLTYVATAPALALLGNATMPMVGGAIAVAGLMMTGTVAMWRLGIARYTGATS